MDRRSRIGAAHRRAPRPPSRETAEAGRPSSAAIQRWLRAYVPQWYQEGFFEPGRSSLAFVDMVPDRKILPDGRVIKGEVHKGEHEAIVDRELFEAVQMRMQMHSVARTIRRTSAPALLTGRIFDDAGYPMSPSHTNKQGVRYRYYVSQALAQGDKHRAGSVTRVSGPDIEDAVCIALRQYHPDRINIDDRALIEQSVARIVVTTGLIRIELASDQIEDSADLAFDQVRKLETITEQFFVRSTARKGYLHQPQSKPAMAPETRQALLKAIARARGWLDEVLTGEAISFEEIASREGLVERLASQIR